MYLVKYTTRCTCITWLIRKCTYIFSRGFCFGERRYHRQHFNVISTLLGWYGVATLGKVKSKLKQQDVCQPWNLQRWTMNVESTLSISTLILANNLWLRHNNIVTFNVEFHVDQHRNTVVNMTIFKKGEKSKKKYLWN